jgi:oligopeptide/dipeptide ABC transporter ATP-binding protein
MAVLVITHNMGVIAEVADRVAVMYSGRVVEQAGVEAIFAAPAHPYTRALLGCVPTLEDERERLASIAGSLPDPLMRPPGCRFAPRCGLLVDACEADVPALRAVGSAHAAACIRA